MSAAPAVRAAQVPPSSFSALLRRSKFASYDPKIGQIYATYDGNAARGDWGLKRPLGMRRRNARRTIHNVDTIYQQTEWTSSYNDAEWIRKFGELEVVPRLEGRWAQRFPSVDRKWLHDSDFSAQERKNANADYLDKYSPAPSTTAMSAKRFERYLRKVRKQRQEFQQFYKDQQGALPSQATASIVETRYAQKPSYEIAQGPGRDYLVRSFLAKQFNQESKSSRLDIIQPVPHPTGGLVYTEATEYQSYFRSRPLPGRALHLLPKKVSEPDVLSLNVAVGGWVGREQALKTDTHVSLTDFGTQEGDPRKNETSGEGTYRPEKCALFAPPEVVGKHPQSLDKAELSLQFVTWEGAEEAQRNNHVPGSREYVAYLNIRRKEAMRREAQEASPAPSYGSGSMLRTRRMGPRKEVVKNKPNQLLGRLRAAAQGPVPSDKDLDGLD